METSNSEKIKPEQYLSELFGSYKAEWLEEKLYDLYTEPAYFPELVTPRPCLLLGGRGTGKTTVLRCLSYEGQFALSGQDSRRIPNWRYYGVYYRVNTNRVTSFEGPELQESEWTRLFAHYFNLLICDLLLQFLEWYQLHCSKSTSLSEKDCSRVGMSLNLQNVKNVTELAGKVDSLKIEFEAFINNVADGKTPLLSIQGAPIDTLIDSIIRLPQFQDKHFFILLDEYENLLDYQQKVINTLIKHSDKYSFKIGVRELGWRQRTTLNENEQLISPADYVRINITEDLSEEEFIKFALAACNARVSKVRDGDSTLISDISQMFPTLSEDDEAERLGVENEVRKIHDTLKNSVTPEDLSVFDNLNNLQAYFINYWSETENFGLEEAFKDFLINRSEWETRYQNYKYAVLFTLKRHKRGIRKYYSGWNVFIKLSARNIRYLLELVDHSLMLHLRKGENLSTVVSQETQTLAAQDVGKKNLSELEGLSVHGAKLTKMLLGLGRIFQVMAEDPIGHSPEVNQFYLSDEKASLIDIKDAEYQQLITSAIMHLALLRFPGSKLTDDGDTRNYDYMIHPIFAPFFVFSYRRKRKMKLLDYQLLELINKPKETIREILSQNNRSEKGELPDQLTLFTGFYSGNS